jgi:hypothetical protein
MATSATVTFAPPSLTMPKRSASMRVSYTCTGPARWLRTPIRASRCERCTVDVPTPSRSTAGASEGTTTTESSSVAPSSTTPCDGAGSPPTTRTCDAVTGPYRARPRVSALSSASPAADTASSSTMDGPAALTFSVANVPDFVDVLGAMVVCCGPAPRIRIVLAGSSVWYLKPEPAENVPGPIRISSWPSVACASARADASGTESAGQPGTSPTQNVPASAVAARPSEAAAARVAMRLIEGMAASCAHAPPGT